MKFMDAGCHVVAGVLCLVSRSGYTGEEGYDYQSLLIMLLRLLSGCSQ